MAKLSNEVKWKRTLRWLRKCFPVSPGRVTVRRVSGKRIGKDHGETAIYTDGKLVTYINEDKHCFQCKIDTILHEWSHILTWFEYGGEREDHTSEWGIIYARIYREHLKWNFGRKS